MMDVTLWTNSSEERTLTIAIGKGRGFEESLGLIQTEQQSEDYKLFAGGMLPVYVDKKNNIRMVKLRNKDLPWMLSKKFIDVAIGSSVWFDEFLQPEIKLLSELPLLKCRLSVISKHKFPVKEIKTICTKFPSLTRKYIQSRGLNSNLILMEGCHEVALSLGMSDAIIDIIETGKTIQRMNLVELEYISHISHGIWTREKEHATLKKLLIRSKEIRIS